MPTITETPPQEKTPTVIVEHLQPGQSGSIDFDSRIDDINEDIAIKGIVGELVAELKMGQQKFLVVKPPEYPVQPGYYHPFLRKDNLSKKSPFNFELDPSSPFVLIHDGADGLTGRALRPGSAIVLGKQAEEQDDKSGRFNYRSDDFLSRYHAQIEVDVSSRTINVHDTNSTNGIDIVKGHSEINKPDFPLIDIVLKDLGTEEQPKVFERSGNIIQSEATKALRHHKEFSRQKAVQVDDKTFFLTGVFEEPDRSYAIMYTTVNKDGENIDVPRLLYKSFSDGGWRVAYGMERTGRLVKEANGKRFHYTQETKLREEIVNALEQTEVVSVTDELLEKAKDIFLVDNEYASEIDMTDEISFLNDPRYDPLLQPIRMISAGQTRDVDKDFLENAGHKSIGNYLRSLDKVFEKLPGFMPDYSQPPAKTVRREHSLLGAISIDEYPAKIGNTDLIWSMARDYRGRVWIDNIRVKDAAVSSYGTSSIVFDGGILTCKPLEYKEQANGLNENEAKPFNRNYDDITPVLNNLLPVKRYRQARGL